MEDASTLVFFTTDRGYLIPTIVAALQVSNQIQTGLRADILIFLIDFRESESSELNAEYEHNRIKFIDMASSVYDNSLCYYHKSHVPKSALARLCVGELIPARYENLIYIDGDVQIVGDIRPLLKWQVRPGYILASLDQGLLEVEEPGSSISKWYARYTRGLGLKEPLEYFNSGVMAFRRSTLLEEGPVSLRYFYENSNKCLQHDQSALNAVFVGRREYLSPRYNFMPRFQVIGGAAIVNPVIMHFADRNKPWHDPVLSWMAEYTAIYTKVINEHSVLGKYVRYMSKQPTSEPYAPAPLKSAALSLAFPFRRIARRRKLKKYMSTTPFAFS
jgi:lipopolysaccharide biosynthesis glycosyltransferase